MNELLLCYLPGPLGWTGALERICREEGIRVIPVAPARCGQTLGALLGMTSPVPVPPAVSHPSEPVLVLCGFTPSRMEVFLGRLGQEGLPPVLKAVVTPTNLGWTLSALVEELAREREEMGG